MKIASRLAIPNLSNIPDERPLDSFLLEKAIAKKINPNASKIDSKKISRIFEQLASVVSRAERLEAKSLGGILALQERIAKMWAEK